MPVEERRLGVLWARVIDDLRDFNVLDRGCDAVKVGHPLTKLVGEELNRRLFRIPDVEVVRPSGGLIQCEELEAKAWHAFELRPSIVGNADHSRAVERILVLEPDVDTNHGSSCGRSAAGRDAFVPRPRSTRTREIADPLRVTVPLNGEHQGMTRCCARRLTDAI